MSRRVSTQMHQMSSERSRRYHEPGRAARSTPTTASNLLFSGDGDGNLLALDSRTGKLLWRHQMGALLYGTSPITYVLDGRQHLLVPSGTTLTAWALPAAQATATVR